MNLKPIKGQHHVSAITGNAIDNYEFYTKVLGMRLVKKSVNQDDTSVYHLFYADERGNPGTDLTFFELPYSGKNRAGTNSVSLTSLRVRDDAAINYWGNRLADHGVDLDQPVITAGRLGLTFRDAEGQRLMLISDQNNIGVSGGKPWDKSPVPIEFGILGLGPVFLTVRQVNLTVQVLTEVMGYTEQESYISSHNGQEIRIFTTGEGGNGGEIHLHEQPDHPVEKQGYGSVHHVAFRVENESELNLWVSRLNEFNIRNSGFVERYYFKSLYFREPNGILFELATDGPGFEGDEEFEKLGERLALPPYFESQRSAIESKLKPLETATS